MSSWSDIATWAGPIPNSGPGRMTAHRGVVIHTAEGSYAGTISWQRNPAADVGSHFVTAKDGRVVQLIDTDIRSWCQSAGNDDWISIENEGFGSRGEALTAAQVECCARILAKAHRVYGVPLQVSNSPSERGLGWHGMGGAAWGGHTGCPGNAIRAQLPAIVARAAQILNPQPEVPDVDAEQNRRLVNLEEREHQIHAIDADELTYFKPASQGGTIGRTPNRFKLQHREVMTRLEDLQRAVGELRATPPGSVVITDEQFERVLRRVMGSVDGATPAQS